MNWIRIVLPLLIATCAQAGEDRPLAGTPAGWAGASRVDDSVEEYLRAWDYAEGEFEPVSDRWRIGFPRWDRTTLPSEELTAYDSPYALGAARNPYRQNVIKGDYPIIGQHTFFVFTLVSDTTVEYRDLPTPAGVSTERPRTPEFFGSGGQAFVNQNIVTSFELFHGTTAFQPPDWLVRITPVFNVNYTDVLERNNVNIDVRNDTTRLDGHIGLQEAFIEKHLVDLSDNYDFVSVTIGIQQFVADPRALIYFDNNLGARLTANWGNNRHQANLAVFYQLEKDTNSDLNRLDFRRQAVLIANYFRQDTLWNGYTFNATFAWNHDEGDEFIDDNGFPVRAPALGAGTRGKLDAFYFGITGDGHIGRLNITNEFFMVVGRDRKNAIAARDIEIEAYMVFLELSYDYDWWRPRFSLFWASGDNSGDGGTGRGFDTIIDNPTFGGAQNSFWIRQRLPLGGTGLVSRFSTFPNLRPNKFQGQANFVNPGLLFLTAGVDLDLAVEWRASVNLSYLMFSSTGALAQILNQNDIDRALGWEATLGVQFRPNAVENVQVLAGASLFLPGQGYQDLYESGSAVGSVFVQLLLTY